MKWDLSLVMPNELRRQELESKLLLVQALRFTLLVNKQTEMVEQTHMLKSESMENLLSQKQMQEEVLTWLFLTDQTIRSF